MEDVEETAEEISDTEADFIEDITNSDNQNDGESVEETYENEEVSDNADGSPLQKIEESEFLKFESAEG